MFRHFRSQALSLLATLLASSSGGASSAVAFPPLWTRAHQEWNIVALLVAVVKTAEIDPEELLVGGGGGGGGGGGFTLHFVEALIALLQTIVQFVSDRIRLVKPPS